MYGLFRHGLFPGPRNLVGIAKIFLYSHREPMKTEVLTFAMQYAGYRFQQASLRSALRFGFSVVQKTWQGWVVRPRKTVCAELRQLGFSPTFRGVDDVAEVCGGVIRNAISEYERRLAGR